MLEIKIQTGRRRYVAPAELVRVIGAARALEELGDMVEALIAQIDMLAGDPDFEETAAEDSFSPPPLALHFAEGPGCTISDEGDVSWSEWHGRRSMRGRRFTHEPIGYREAGDIATEDDEEDDPPGQSDEDGVNTGLRALRASAGAGCPISDPDNAVDDRGCDEPDEPALPILAYGEDQSEPLHLDPAADRRILQSHRDFIRGMYYQPVRSRWPGYPPTYVRTGEEPETLYSLRQGASND